MIPLLVRHPPSTITMKAGIIPYAHHTQFSFRKMMAISTSTSCSCNFPCDLQSRNTYLSYTPTENSNSNRNHYMPSTRHRRDFIRQFQYSSSSSSSSSSSPSSSSSSLTSSLSTLLKSFRKPPSTPSILANTTVDYSPETIRKQMAEVMNEYLVEKSPETKRAKKDELKLRKHEQLMSEEGKRLVETFDNYILFEKKEDANLWAEGMIVALMQQQSIDNTKPVYVGVHVGWNSHGKKRERSVTHLFSISFPNQPVICLHLYKLGCFKDEKKFPEKVRQLLQLPFIKACGIHVNRFLARIKRYLHVIVPVRMEIDKLAMIMEPRTMKEEMRKEMGYLDFFEDPKKKRLPSMKTLCSKYLNVEIDGTIGMPHNIDYFKDPLPEKYVKFSTLEAYHYRLLCETMMNMVENDITMPQPSVKFQVGTKVKVFINSRVNHVAEGIIEYLGGVNSESICFGEKMINQGTALVRIIEVLQWDVKPKYHTETYMLYGLQWDRDVTMSAIFASPLPIIPVDTKRLVRMDEVDTNLFKEIVKKPKKLSKARLKKRKKKKLARLLQKQEKADAEAKASNFWFV